MFYEKDMEPSISPESSPQRVIDPENVIAWLVTQPNARGTLYLENVARQYMYTLRYAPSKLKLSIAPHNGNVFACHTVDELMELWRIFKNAPNYKQVNAKTSSMFAAGMNCLLRYLQHLSKTESSETIHELDIIELVKNLELKYVDKRNLGGALWVIGGRELTPEMGKLSDSGFGFRFKEGGGRSSGYKDAWWYKSKSMGKRPNRVTPSEKFTLDPTTVEKVTDILLAHFPNGYRLNSPIELIRFQSFAIDKLGEEVLLSDELLKRHIAGCGIIFDGKIYAIPAQAKCKIKELAEKYFADGARVIFFDEFFAKNEGWLFRKSVISEGLLIKILRRLFPELLFTKTYFGHMDSTIFVALESEILRVWGDDILLTYQQICERLQYIPLERIKFALGQNADFIWNSVGTFSHVNYITISDEEKEGICEIATQECNAHGYVLITNLPLGEIKEHNFELSMTAIHNAVYRICLSDQFDKKGKIVTRKGDVFDVATAMKEYCKTIDKCSLDNLLDYGRDLTDEVHRRIAMEAGNAILIRIDKDTYVAESYVHFDTDVIDEVIGLFIKKDYLPLKSFTTFGVFPDCGQEWNLFLLESYCRRFSQQYRFDAPSVNSRNAGVVIHKSCELDYTEIIVDAVANSGVPLKSTDVGRFLYMSGYTGRSTAAKVGKIIDQAKVIRKRRI